MPCALSEIGPYVSIDTMTPTVVSMPMPVSAMKYRRSAVVSPRRNAAMMSPRSRGSTTRSTRGPTENPASTVVAGPVSVASAISCTGRCFVSVKYCVSTWMTLARIRPNATANAGLSESMYMFEITNTAAAEMTAEMKKPRLMAFIPCSFSLRGATGEDADDRRDHADRADEQREHHADDRADLASPAYAAAPRISEATSVTS